MQRFLTWVRGLIGARAVAGAITPAPVLWVSTQWARNDMQNLAAFLGSVTGQRLIQRLRAYESANAIAGAKDVMHTSHSAGRAVGYGDCIEHMISLTRASQGETKPDEDKDTSIEELLRMSP